MSENKSIESLSSACFDCGVTLNEQNRTNKDNVLDVDEDPQPICDDCSEDRWRHL